MSPTPLECLEYLLIRAREIRRMERQSENDRMFDLRPGRPGFLDEIGKPLPDEEKS